MRILVAWELGGGWGHIARVAPLARGLLERGHEVLLAAPDSARLVARIPGAAALPLPAVARPPTPLVAPTATFADILANAGWHSDDELRRLTAAWLDLYDRVAPDLLLIDYGPTALLAAQARPLRRVLLADGFTAPPDVTPLPNLLPDAPPGAPPPADSAAREEALRARADAWLVDHGAPSLERLAALFTRVDLRLLATWPELDHNGARRGAEYRGVWNERFGGAPEWPQGEGPRVVAYLKEFPALDALLHLLRRSGLPVLACLSQSDAARRAAHAAPNLHLTDAPFDLERAGADADLAILNGGHGATATLLRTGTPILQIPLRLEQFLVARRVVEMGAGQVAAHNAPDQLARGLQRLLTELEYTRAAAAFAARHAAYDPARAVGDAVAAIDALA